jgi:hypothetical protein
MLPPNASWRRAGLAVVTMAGLWVGGVFGGAQAGLPAVDRSRLLITFDRGECFGECPAYRVSIDGQGKVVFRASEGVNWVLVPGRHGARIAPSAVDALVEKFRRVRFFDLADEYRYGITDAPIQTLTIDTGHGRKRVVDHVGTQAGMPRAVSDLEDEIDRVAGTARWVRGAEGLVDWLAGTGFDFRSRAAALIAMRGVERADETTLIAMIARGLPMEMASGLDKAGLPTSVGVEMTRGAILAGRLRLFRRLAASGWLARMPAGMAAQAFAASAGACNPGMVDALVRHGISIDDGIAPGPDRSPNGDTALANVASGYDCADEPARIATLERLLANGANPNHRDSNGETAIFGVENGPALDLLLASGADATVRDKHGKSAAFSSWTDAIVLRLLKAGASPVGHYDDGRTLHEQMKERPMPAVAQWLDMQGR